MRVLPKWHIIYGNLSTSLEYLYIPILSLAEYLY